MNNQIKGWFYVIEVINSKKRRHYISEDDNGEVFVTNELRLAKKFYSREEIKSYIEYVMPSGDDYFLITEGVELK